MTGANNAFVFAPTSISGGVPGDTVTFTFVSRNHSATSTVFVKPCPPPPGGADLGAFDIGFNPTTATDHPVHVVTITDTEPHFVACMPAGGGHCHAGMTFAINPTADQSYDAFLSHALTDPIQTQRVPRN